MVESLLFCSESHVIALDSPSQLVENDYAHSLILAVVNDSSNHGEIGHAILGSVRGCVGTLEGIVQAANDQPSLRAIHVFHEELSYC